LGIVPARFPERCEMITIIMTNLNTGKTETRSMPADPRVTVERVEERIAKKAKACPHLVIKVEEVSAHN
tara:strand:+ start:236 stop:442 length:207 start_codon:yes stop_codon:yes gene_type:complete